MSFLTEADNVFGISNKYYLNKAKQFAQKTGYNPNLLKFSENPKYKLNYDGVNFGNAGYNDYIIYKRLEKTGLADDNEAEKRRQLYLHRSKFIKGNWKNNKLSKNNLSRSIIWNA